MEWEGPCQPKTRGCSNLWPQDLAMDVEETIDIGIAQIEKIHPWEPIKRICVDCGIKHLIQDCPSNPEFKGKPTLNYVEIITSSSTSSSESEHIVSVKVVTRAQAKA